MPRDPNVEIFIKYACRKLPDELPIRLRGGFRFKTQFFELLSGEKSHGAEKPKR